MTKDEMKENIGWISSYLARAVGAQVDLRCYVMEHTLRWN
jgi:hypothetical protein